MGWGGVLLFGDLPLPLGLPFATAAPRGSGDRKAPGLWPREPPTLGPSVSPQPSDEENSDNSNECVVCLSDLRDTLILPCRHLCLCNSCADTLRYQASNCPICRLREWDGRAGGRAGRETGTVADVGRDPCGDGVAPSASREVRRRASIQEGLQGSVWGELHRSDQQVRSLFQRVCGKYFDRKL